MDAPKYSCTYFDGDETFDCTFTPTYNERHRFRTYTYTDILMGYAPNQGSLLFDLHHQDYKYTNFRQYHDVVDSEDELSEVSSFNEELPTITLQWYPEWHESQNTTARESETVPDGQVSIPTVCKKRNHGKYRLTRNLQTYRCGCPVPKFEVAPRTERRRFCNVRPLVETPRCDFILPEILPEDMSYEPDLSYTLTFTRSGYEYPPVMCDCVIPRTVLRRVKKRSLTFDVPNMSQAMKRLFYVRRPHTPGLASTKTNRISLTHAANYIPLESFVLDTIRLYIALVLLHQYVKRQVL